MNRPQTIDKNRVLRPSQDYAALRAAGMEYIRNLSGKIWTDHNLHDPGITTLEILCYALTDLGYRTGFKTEDLLSTPSGQELDPKISSFFPAPEILTNTPLTIGDYRTLLLKIEGLRNAWLDPMMDDSPRENEVPIYADCYDGELNYQAVNNNGTANKRVELSGLYKVLLELEIDEDLGSLNQTRLYHTIQSGTLKGFQISVDWEQPKLSLKKHDFSLEFAELANPDMDSPDGTLFPFKADLYMEDNTVVTEMLQVGVIKGPTPEAVENLTPSKIKNFLESAEADLLFSRFWIKQQKIRKILDAVCCALDAHRNLCEDFFSVERVSPENVAICTDIEVTPQADLEKVQAHVVFAIEEYLNPRVKYYSLQELLDEGWCPSEIFNGPYINYKFECAGKPVFTKPGFIKRTDLENSELRKVVHASDIINLVMDIEDVVAVRDLQLIKYDADGKPLGPSERWCLPITADHQPVLYLDKSKILFFKESVPYFARKKEFENILNQLRALARKESYIRPDSDMERPLGNYREPGQQFSIQHDFPQVYHIGEEGLPTAATPERIAQAQQFKAYLTFYDQMLADYLAQLAHLPELFSLKATVHQTYFSRFLQNFDADSGEGIAGSTQSFQDEFFLDKAALQPLVESGRFSEDETLYQDRRNRLLDHLIARFSEQFTDYVLMMYDVTGENLKTREQLIGDKISFLQEYPQISRERNKAFNYRPEDTQELWDTENVSGLQRRVARLSGIQDYSRRNLSCSKLFDNLFSTRKVSGQNKYMLEIKNADHEILFQSVTHYNTPDLALDAGREIYPFLLKYGHYAIDDSQGTGNIVYSIKDDGAVSIENDRQFESVFEANGNIQQVMDRYNELLESTLCDEEGLFLFEHILLRPMNDNFNLMEVCLDEGCEACGDEDPYSFRISVVMPYWPRRFQSLEFRKYFERTVREQAPAHIHAKVCWVGNDDMMLLEKAYKEWLQIKSKKKPNLTTLKTKQNTLIAVLQNLKTIYPKAVLHDCDDDDDGSPVRLDSTSLGGF